MLLLMELFGGMRNMEQQLISLEYATDSGVFAITLVTTITTSKEIKRVNLLQREAPG